MSMILNPFVLGVAPSSSLLTGIVFAYHVEEASSTRIDATGRGNDLTPHGDTLPGNAVGKIDNAVSLGALQYLDAASTTDLQLGSVGSFSVSLWVKFTTYSTTGSGTILILSKQDTGSTREFGLSFDSATHLLQTNVWIAGNVAKTVTASTIGALALNTWYHIALWFDSVAQTHNIRVNDGGTDSIATSASSIQTSTGTFNVNFYPPSARYSDGVLVDELLGWKRVLTAGEITTLAAGGATSAYPFDGSAAPALSGFTEIACTGFLDFRNGITIRDDAIASWISGGTTYQVLAYWQADTYATLAKRTKTGGTWSSWTIYHYDGSGGLANITADVGGDLHNVINIGIDAAGYVHVVYDNHNNPLRYRKSDAPLSSWTGGLTTTLSMLGTNESEVSYPTFCNDPAGTLYMLFRDGNGSGNCDGYMYAYSGSAWAAATGTGTAGKLIDGKGATPTTLSPYWDGAPRFDSNFGSGGYMHMSWCWRDSTGQYWENHDIQYMRWDGTNWTTEAGTSKTAPFAKANTNVVNAIANNSGYLNQNAIDCDSNGRPHIVYYRTVSSQSHIYHYWYNGSAWVENQVTTTASTPFDGSHYLLGRPELAIDRTTNTAYILYHDNADGKALICAKSGANDFTTWTKTYIYNRDVGYLEATYDRGVWLAEKKLHIPIAPYASAADDGLVGVVEYAL
jgi:hypothetical protein